MKSHSLIRWALVFVIAVLLLPAADGAAATGSQSTYQISAKSSFGSGDSSSEPAVGTTNGDPDDVGGGETKTGQKPGPIVNNGTRVGSVDSISQLWEVLVGSIATLFRI